MAATCPAYLTILDLIILTIFGRVQKYGAPQFAIFSKYSSWNLVIKHAQRITERILKAYLVHTVYAVSVNTGPFKKKFIFLV
jgi:hypothetical protein